MSYAFMSISKIKNYGTMNSKCNHNQRRVRVNNADPERAYLNETLVDTGINENGRRANYAEAVKNRMGQLPYYQNHKPRSNQVLAYEVLLTFSRDDTVNLNDWKNRNLKWLRDTFDVAPDGHSNILSVEYHADETGNVHIHALVTPIDENGRLNAQRFTGGSKKMRDLQTSYGDYMAPLGLERGVQDSSLSHKEIAKMYASLNNAMQIPEVLPGETADAYRDRVSDELETRFAVKYREADDYVTERHRKIDLYSNKMKEDLNRERQKLDEETERVRSTVASAHRELEQVRKKTDTIRDECEMLEAQKDALLDQMYYSRLEAEKDKEDAKRYRRIMYGLKLLQAEDPARAAEIEEGMAQTMQEPDWLSR